MNIEISNGVIPASEMTRDKWIAFFWEDVRTYADKEPMYLCMGLRDIAQAKEAAEQFDIWVANTRRQKHDNAATS